MIVIPTVIIIIYSMSSFCAGILSSSTNFLIYCFIGHNFRKEFLVLLGLKRKMVSRDQGNLNGLFDNGTVTK